MNDIIKSLDISNNILRNELWQREIMALTSLKIKGEETEGGGENEALKC